MSVIEIVVRPFGGDPLDITDHVIWSTATFESQLSAVPGTCSFTVRDMDRDQMNIIGSEITMSIDGTPQWGGYLRSIGMAYAFPADDTSDVDSYKNRSWQLEGVDYNTLFDQRVVRNPNDYAESLPIIPGSTQDGDAIRTLLSDFIDMPEGFDTSTFIDDITTVAAAGTGSWSYVQQGTVLRQQMDQFVLSSAASYYIDAEKNVHYHAIETLESRWGFSDVPNNATISGSPNEFQDAYYGFREVTATEDGSQLINDVIIWGGSEWAGTAGGTVYSRVENTDSIDLYGRWQAAQVHIGETNFKTQAGVDSVANALVFGPPGVDAYGEQKGLRYSQWQVRCAWHDKDVPRIDDEPVHLRAGMLVNVNLAVFDTTKLLPLRSLTITFPEAKDTGETYVRFDGEFGLQLSDPFTLWAVLLKREKQIQRPPITAVVDNDSPSVPHGALGQMEAEPTPDGVETVFTIPFPYIAGTTQVYLDPDGSGGILQRIGVDYTESNPDGGEITFLSAPTGVLVSVIARMQAGTSEGTTEGTIVPATAGALEAAVSAASPGDVLLLRGGDHLVDDIIYVPGDVTIRNYGSERPVITHPTAEAEFLFFEDGPNLLQGLVFVGVLSHPDDYVHGSALVSMQAGSHDNTIQNCEFHGAPGYGATQQLIYHHAGGSGAQILNCLIDGHGGGGFGVHLYPGPGPDDVLVQGNIIQNFPNKSGVLCWTDSGGIQILDNTFAHCGSAVRHHNSNGTYVDGNTGIDVGPGLEVDDATNLTVGSNSW